MIDPRRPWGALLRVALALALVHLEVLAWAPACCLAASASKLAPAEADFKAGNYDAALRTLNELVALEQLEKGQETKAFEWIARCHVRLGERAAAVEAFCKLFKLDPAWRADASAYTTDELAAFREAFRECTPMPGAAAPSETATPPETATHPDSATPPQPGTPPEAATPPQAAPHSPPAAQPAVHPQPGASPGSGSGSGRIGGTAGGKKSKSWVWLVAGGAAATVAAVLLAGKGGGGEAGPAGLPGFPNPPSGPSRRGR